MRDMPGQRRKRIWVQHVAVEAHSARLRLALAAATGQLTGRQEAAAKGVAELLAAAEAAANREDPIPGRFLNWWRGTLVEAAYRNLHAARSMLVELLDDAEIDAEAAGAIMRARSALHPGDIRHVNLGQFRQMELAYKRAWLQRLMEDSYENIDLRHARLRNFRNIILMAAVVIILLVGATVVFVSQYPEVLPLCFAADASGATAGGGALNCPTATATATPTGGDIVVVALIGLLGGALTATVAIRGLHGTSTAYDVPVALAWLKVPLGAFTAILGLVAIRGGFIPGLSTLDSQAQILAYALVLGFAQQALTQVLDKQAKALISEMPNKEGQRDHTTIVVADSRVADALAFNESLETRPSSSARPVPTEPATRSWRAVHRRASGVRLGPRRQQRSDGNPGPKPD
jgi:hypothetical protein